MLFNSYQFVFGFLPITFLLFVIASRFAPQACSPLIATASIIFYAWWDVRFLWLLGLSIGLNFTFGRLISRSLSEIRARRWAITGITMNLTFLAYFKYRGFLLDNLSTIVPIHHQAEHVALPLGISFYTFTQIAFLVDVFRYKAKEYSLSNYILFVSYFPHLIAGPIIHHREMMPQFASPHVFRPNPELLPIGVLFAVIGLMKKVLVADSLAPYADAVFDNAAVAHPDIAISWLGALSYTFQIYFDFSGYCDMAIGISLLFGISLPYNFDSPYKASNIIDFWRRWHITLSRFLKEYLYISLGGNRGSPLFRYRNLMLTMLLGGLWHGASWTFVIWGGLHGLYLVVNHGWRALRAGRSAFLPSMISASLGTLSTFVAVAAAWIFFRATSLPAATAMLKGMVGLNGIPGSATAADASLSSLLGYPETLRVPLMLVAASLALAWLFPNTQQIASSLRDWMQRWRWNILGGGLVATTLLLAVNASRSLSPFIYFNF